MASVKRHTLWLIYKPIEAATKDLALELAASQRELTTVKAQYHSNFAELKHSLGIMTNVQTTHNQLLATVVDRQVDCQAQLKSLATAVPEISQDLVALWDSTQASYHKSNLENFPTLAEEFAIAAVVSQSRPLWYFSQE